MPPIMGAAAFLMAEMVGVPYADIIGACNLPAFLYFLGIFLGVHFKAKKLGLKGLPREELPKWKILLPQIYLIPPAGRSGLHDHDRLHDGHRRRVRDPLLRGRCHDQP